MRKIALYIIHKRKNKFIEDPYTYNDNEEFSNIF